MLRLIVGALCLAMDAGRGTPPPAEVRPTAWTGAGVEGRERSVESLLAALAADAGLTLWVEEGAGPRLSRAATVEPESLPWAARVCRSAEQAGVDAAVVEGRLAVFLRGGMPALWRAADRLRCDEAGRESVLDRVADCRWEDVTPRAACESMQRAYGVRIELAGELGARQETIYVVGESLPLRQVLDEIARQLGCGYEARADRIALVEQERRVRLASSRSEGVAARRRVRLAGQVTRWQDLATAAQRPSPALDADRLVVSATTLWADGAAEDVLAAWTGWAAAERGVVERGEGSVPAARE